MPRSTNNEYNQMIGKKLKQLRTSMGISRAALGSRINISPQQIAKYENGESCISASMLLVISDRLQKPASYFFDYKEEPLDKITRGAMERSRCYMQAEEKENKVLLSIANILSAQKDIDQDKKD